MHQPDLQGNPPSTVRKPVLLGLFAGTAVGLGYLLAGVPNVELMTLVVAVAGGVLGLRLGVLCGCLVALVYSLGSPYGPAPPLLLIAQAVGMGGAGAAGWLVRRPLLGTLAEGRRYGAMLMAGSTGLVATILYEGLTNAAIMVTLDLDPRVVVTGAIPFLIIHVGVNTVLFTLGLPAVLPRAVRLATAPLIAGPGQTMILVLTLLMSCPQLGLAQEHSTGPAAAPTDQEAADQEVGQRENIGLEQEVSAVQAALGWDRPLWDPFAETAVEWLTSRYRMVGVQDGGLGAPLILLDEGGTTSQPLFMRDGIPVGTGHVLADDPWLVPVQGLQLRSPVAGYDGWGGMGGAIDLTQIDAQPDKAISVYRGTKGPHETYLRGVHLLTPRAAWRLNFSFEESLDQEGYNYTDLPDDIFLGSDPDQFPGHGKMRQGSGRLIRQLGDSQELTVQFGTARKTKDSLPALGVEHQEIWGENLAVSAGGGHDLGRWRAAMFWNNRDVQLGDRGTYAGPDPSARLLESSREGLLLELGDDPAARESATGSGTGLRLTFSSWRLHDSGVEATWAGSSAGPRLGDGQEAHLAGGSALALGPVSLALQATGDWNSWTGMAPGGGVVLSAAELEPWWSLSLVQGGRAPRSDELLTPLTHNVDGRLCACCPTNTSRRENTRRAGLSLQRRLLGTQLAVDASWRQTTGGITWVPLADQDQVGRWANALDLDAYRLTGRLWREGRLLGWGRALLEGTWRKFEENAGTAAFLPPRESLRLELMWENHFFAEDGILQVALMSTVSGSMNDPWDPTRTVVLPQRTVHDLFLGFRLVGAHLSLVLRNLTGQRTMMSAGALSPGQEKQIRLHWTFLY